METEPLGLLQRYRALAIGLFIVVVVLSGIVLILIAPRLADGDKDLESIILTLGSVLFAAGLVQITAEVFLSPSAITLLRRNFPWLANPLELPRATRISVHRDFLASLFGEKKLVSEIQALIDKVFSSVIERAYRSDTKVSLKLEFVSINGKEVAKGTASTVYSVHNISGRPLQYKVPFWWKTLLFDGIPIEQHIKLVNVMAMGAKLPPKGLSLGKVTELSPKEMDGSAILELPSNCTVEIPPDEMVQIAIDWEYLARRELDSHTQRTSILTRNLTVDLDYDPEQMIVDIDNFCIPERHGGGKHYSWEGWFLPEQGFGITWRPKPRQRANQSPSS